MEEETYVLGPNGEKLYGVWYAKTNCYKCYGRGYIGRDVKNDYKIPCKCLRFVKRKTNENIQNNTNSAEGVGEVGL